ncbi:MAG: (Fe-S)-binding protein [Deltaproteobacteria bacterium]|nr:(Fe-S)-binding protein [Deltaproteobacteria bacterium]
MTARQIVFIALLLIASGLFARTARRMVGALRRGRPTLAGFRDWGGRVGDVLLFFFFQRSVAREGLSWHHLPIFWGFLIITVGTVEIVLSGAIPSFSFAWLFGTRVDHGFKTVLDLANLWVLAMVTWGFLRRIIIKPRLIPLSLDAALVLGLIGLLCVSHFVHYAFGGHEVQHLPISAYVARLAGAGSTAVGHTVAEVAWWTHVLIILFFLNYIPHSKHIHLLGSLPNILLRNRGQRGVLPKLDLEDENQWGVSRFDQFDWKSLLDTYACTDCARCSNNCPAMATDKPLSPMHLIHDVRHEMLARGALLARLSPSVKPGVEAKPDEPKPSAQDEAVLKELEALPSMVGGRIKDETLWSCTTCGACEAVCPVFIEHPMKILQMRTHITLAEEHRVPGELKRMFRGIENNQNPWGIGSDKRMDWAEGLDVPVMADKGEAEYLVWIGCAGSFDDSAKKISRAWVQLLSEAGVDFAVLGLEEGCTGDAARRAGNEFLFQMMAEANVETLKGYKVKKILTTCPHCFHSFKNEYPAFGGTYEVTHHSQFLAKLVAEGKLKPSPKVQEAVAYHDACYLGRWNNEYENPRAVVAAATGKPAMELPRHHEKSFCCGAGGAHMWMEEHGPRMNVNRTEEAVKTGAKTIATACPFCNVMLSDGIKALNRDDDVRVVDLAQLLAEALPKSSAPPAGDAPATE